MSLSVTMSGMKVAQKELDVIGNNIANAGTDGFKRSVTSFADVFPNDPSASPKTAVGQGAVIALISRDTSQGSVSSTGKVTDLAISGSGYFTLDSGGSQVYTRSGSFAVDKLGFLTDSSSNIVQMAKPDNSTIVFKGDLSSIGLEPGAAPVSKGTADGTWETSAPKSITSLTDIRFPVFLRPKIGDDGKPDYTLKPSALFADGTDDSTPPANYDTSATASQFDGTLQSVSVDSKGLISSSFSGFQSPYPIGFIAIANFPNPAALQPIGNTDFAASGESGKVSLSAGGTPGTGNIMSGSLESSNVDITTELVKMLKAQQLYNGNARALQTQVEVASRVTDKL